MEIASFITSIFAIVISGITLYYTWRLNQEDISVNFVEENNKIFVHQITLDPAKNFECNILAIGRKYKFSLVNKTDESIFITKVYYKDPKTNNLTETKLFNSNLPIELTPSIPYETTIFLPIYVPERAGDLISMHLLKDDYGKIFESAEIDETIKGHIQHYIFLAHPTF